MRINKGSAENDRDSDWIRNWSKKIMAVNLLGGKCISCGCEDIFVLTFHHPNKNKEKVVGNLFKNRWSKIKLEVQKCELLCRNCHIELHCIEGSRRDKTKNQFLNMIQTTCCFNCGYKGKNVASLNFHHTDPEHKEFCISTGIRNHESIQKIIEEMNKCEVLCANCHVKIHINVARFNLFKEKIYQRARSYNEGKYDPKNVSRKVVIKLYRKGISRKKIADMMKCSQTTIFNIVNKNEEYHDSEFKDRVLKLKQAGLTERKISKKMKCSRGKIVNVLRSC